MGFFFANAGRKQKAKRSARNSGPRATGPKTKQAAATLNRLGCKTCPLKNDCDKDGLRLPEEVDIYFLTSERKLSKEHKKLLLDELPDTHNIAFGGVLWGAPESGDRADWVAVESCRGHVTAHIEQARPRLIVGLGLAALQWAVGSSDMEGLRGRLFALQIGEHRCWFMPMNDPEYILKYAYKPDRPLQSRMGHAFKMDLKRVFSIIDDLRPPKIWTAAELKEGIITYDGHGPDQLKKLVADIEQARDADDLSIDLETYPVRPYHKDAVLLTVSLSWYIGKQIKTIAFAAEHPKAGWNEKQLKVIYETLRWALKKKRSRKIAHNAPFEIEWLLEYLGPEIVQHENWECTMMQAHHLDERKGANKGGSQEGDRASQYQKLGFLCKMYFGLDVKTMFKLNKKDMRKADLHETLVYNGVDTRSTLLLFDHQDELLEQEGRLLEAYDFAKPRQTTVAYMQRIGINVNQKTVRKFQEKLNTELKGIEAEIQNTKVVKQYVKDKKLKEFNPHSTHEVLEIFRDYLKRDEVNVLKKNAKDADDTRQTVEKGVLEKIDHPLAKAILQLRNRAKLKSTYVDELLLPDGTTIYPDGKLHTSFNTTFTTSGRTSSDEPNLQNWPKRNDAWVREQIEAQEDYIIIAADYGQLEWCMACVCSKDKAMLDATWNEYDVHLEWTHKIKKLWPDLVGGKEFFKNEKAIKRARGMVKNKMVFPTVFGAQMTSVAGYLNMPITVAEPIFEEFWATFFGLKKWQDKLMSQYYDEGFVENLTGRRRRYPLSRSEAINYPIQSIACDVVVDAMNRLSYIAFETGKEYLHPVLNIHDDLTFVVPNKDPIIEEAIETIYREMLRLPFDWINVPMSVEVSLGLNWAKMEELGKFWSHKDL